MRRWRRHVVCVGPCAIALAGGWAPALARAAIVVEPGANKVTTSRLQLDFGDGAGNVERVDSLRWSDSAAVLGANLVSGTGPGCGDQANGWGEAASAQGMPAPVGSGSTGSWTPRGLRSIEINSSRPTLCTADAVTPVRTRYTFFDVGGAASKLRVERTFAFSASTPAYGTAVGMRPYIPHLPSSYSQVIHPNLAGTALQPDSASNVATPETNWNGTWLALNDPATNAGMVILRDPTDASPARLILEDDPAAGVNSASSVDLLRPSGGWHAPLTETEWLCFYDATSWPLAQRSPTNLPSQCSAVPVPINTAPPTISGDARVGSSLTATGGAWDGLAGAPTFQWVRCVGTACTPIAGATGATYTAGDADEGDQLRVDVTARAPGGEADTASAITVGVKPGPPQSTGPPAVSGEARSAETLSAATGNWTGTPLAFAFQWRRCANADGTACVDLPGATSATYLLRPADVGSTLRVRVTATNAQGISLPADSAQTAVVQREVIRARMSLGPNPSCTGLSTTLDGSASTTPNGPITRYRFVGQELPIGVVLLAAFGGQSVIDDYIAKAPKLTIADGSNPAPGVAFNWNRQLFQDERPGLKGFYARDPLVVTLTVTDLSGATSTTSDLLAFSQAYSNESRSVCPKPFHDLQTYVIGKVKLSDFGSIVKAKIPCRSRIGCSGSYKVVRATQRRSAGGGPSKPAVIASSSLFELRAGTTQTVPAKLTRLGRRLLRTRVQVTAKLIVTSITPTGRRVTRSLPVLLPPR